MSGHRSSALVLLLAVVAAGCGAAPSDMPNPGGDGVQQSSTVAVGDLTTVAPIEASSTATPAPTPTPTASPTSNAGAEAMLLAGVVPEHGIAYTTASGVSVAALDGTVLFAIPGVHIVDSSRDLLAMAAVVSFGKYGDPPTDEYALAIGTITMQPAAARPDPSPYAIGWTAADAPAGCVRDARRVGSMLLLCAPSGSDLPSDVAIAGDGPGAIRVVAHAPEPSGGHWVDAIQGPDGSIAATWSGECEAASAFRIAADGAVTDLSGGTFAVVLGWDGDDVLVARAGGCGPDGPDSGVFRVGPDGAEARVPTPDATELPVAW